MNGLGLGGVVGYARWIRCAWREIGMEGVGLLDVRGKVFLGFLQLSLCVHG